MTASKAQDHLFLIDIGVDVHLRGEGTGVMDRSVDVLAFSGIGAVHQGGDDSHVGVVAADMPGVAAARRDGDIPGNVVAVIAATAHLPSCG